MDAALLDALTRRLRAAGCVFAEEEAALLLAELSGPAGSAGLAGSALADAVARREAGEPLETILGWAGFDGVRVPVAAGVFVPRPRSLALVEVVAAHLRPGARVLDLCCGTGALGVAVAARVPEVDLWACDLDPAATACARRHLAAQGHARACAAGQVLDGDLFAALPERLRGGFDAIVCNAPYVPTAAIALLPPEARDHEAVHALDGGADGLDLHRRIAAEASAWLRPGGVLAHECAPGQAAALTGVLASAGLAARAHLDEERDTAVVIGQTVAR